MADDTRRSFDLKSWQGLTMLLKVARESNLAPSAYAEFRNLVLKYAQQKGGDPELKQKIDSIIATFNGQNVALNDTEGGVAEAPADRLGRRVVPVFSPRTVIAEKRGTPIPQEVVPPAIVVEEYQGGHAQNVTIHQNIPPVIPPTEISKAPPLPVVDEIKEETSPGSKILKSVEDHRARILEIKRQVNALVENPIALVDHGNQIGREYMSALLGALKATSPGATHALEEKMEELEEVFERVLAYASHPHEDVTTQNAISVDEIKSETKVDSDIPLPPIDLPEVSETHDRKVVPELPIETVSVSHSILPEFAHEQEHEQEKKPFVEEKSLKAPAHNDTEEDVRWTEAGGDLDKEAQIEELRNRLKEMKKPVAPQGASGHSSALLGISEEGSNSKHTHGFENQALEISTEENPDELSLEKLTHRQQSSLTGITLGTPQSDLMTPEITMALSGLLREWKIFASSGIFGMGPGGIEHPLYVRISRLPMGEVLSGRFEHADMKVIRNIKDYIDAWRHEQGVAYNPTETFEHYLRRVSQRILKRQKEG